jgi:hypothetical protein
MRLGNFLPKHEVQRLGLNVWEQAGPESTVGAASREREVVVLTADDTAKLGMQFFPGSSKPCVCPVRRFVAPEPGTGVSQYQRT